MSFSLCFAQQIKKSIFFPFSFIHSVNIFWAPVESQVLNSVSDDTQIRHTSPEEAYSLEGGGWKWLLYKLMIMSPCEKYRNSGEHSAVRAQRKGGSTLIKAEKASQGGDVWAGS